MDPKVQQAIQYFQGAARMNPNDPSALNRLKEMYNKARNIKSSPNYGRYPVELRSAVEDAYQNLSAMPQITGIKTQVQGNKWEESFPSPPPLGIKRK